VTSIETAAGRWVVSVRNVMPGLSNLRQEGGAEVHGRPERVKLDVFPRMSTTSPGKSRRLDGLKGRREDADTRERQRLILVLQIDRCLDSFPSLVSSNVSIAVTTALDTFCVIPALADAGASALVPEHRERALQGLADSGR